MKVEKQGNKIIIENEQPNEEEVQEELIKMKSMVKELQETIDILLGE